MLRLVFDINEMHANKVYISEAVGKIKVPLPPLPPSPPWCKPTAI